MDKSPFLLIKRLSHTGTLISFLNMNQKLARSKLMLLKSEFHHQYLIFNFSLLFIIKSGSLDLMHSVPLRNKTSDDLLNFSYVWSVSLDLPRSVNTY